MHHTIEELRTSIENLQDTLTYLRKPENRAAVIWMIGNLKQRLAWQLRTGRTF